VFQRPEDRPETGGVVQRPLKAKALPTPRIMDETQDQSIERSRRDVPGQAANRALKRLAKCIVASRQTYFQAGTRPRWPG